MKPNPKIIIIGAGASGLACASRLLKNGMSNVIILEAENRIGGRIHSTKFGENFADLGGQWCHGEKNNIVYEMVKDMSILNTAKNSYQDNTYYLSKGKIVDKSTSDKLFSIANSIYGDSKSVVKQLESFGDYFTRTFQQEVEKDYGNNVEILNLAKLMLDWFHKFYLCLEAAETWYDVPRSSSFPYEICEGDQQLHWGTGGYKTILDVLLEKIPDPSKQIQIDDKLMLNKEVNSVSWDLDDGSGVIVECADGTLFKADHVVVTVSLGVLKHGHKKIFKPELPFNKQNAIEGLSMGNTNKILLRFTEKWWPDDLTGFSLVWNEDDRINLANEFPHGPIEGGKSWLEDILGFYVIDSHPNVLLGWLVGEQTRKVELLTDEVVTSGCMHLLKKFAGHLYDIPEPIDILRSKWGNNKHFYGSYSHVSMETEKRGVSKDDLSKPVFSKNNNPTLLLAGEHTHPHYFSTVHGAIETGYREAGRLLNIYRFHQFRSCL